MKYLAISAALVLAAPAGWLVLREPARIDPGDATQVARGAPIYAESCAACHGAQLQGEADWQTTNEDGTYRAPPHTEDGHTWHHADTLLFNYVKLGGAELFKDTPNYPSAMPGFGDTLSDRDIRDVLAFVKSNWPERAQAYQREMTENEKLN